MKFVRNVKEYEIYGQSYTLKTPVLKDAQEFEESTENMTEKEQARAMLGLLERAGLPVDVSLEMEPNHLMDLIADLMPQKKS